MNPRERVVTSLAHKEPDRVPIDLAGTVCSGIHIVAHNNLAQKLGLGPTAEIVDMIQQLARPDERMLEKFNSDFRPVYMKPPNDWAFVEQVDESGRTYFVDEWGIKWGRNLYYYDMIDHPLKEPNMSALAEYSLPDVKAPGRMDGVKEEAKRLFEDTDFAIVAGVSAPGPGLFEQAWWLRGLPNFFVDMMTRPDYAEALLDRILNVQMRFYAEYLSAVGPYVQVVEWGDDYGMQTGPLISPALYRKFIRPRVAKFFNLIKSKTSGKIFFHSCGSVYPFIEDLIESGVDILNPIQPLAANMDHARLKREFGSKLSFHGGLDIQELLPRGRPEEVKEGVKKLLSNMAPQGGYIFAPAHNVQADVPPENIITMFEAAKQYGHYPLAP